MRTLSVTALLMMAASALAADDKPVRWEYAELSFRTIPPRPKGVDKDGNEVPAAPPGATLRWTTGSEDVSLKGWDELAEHLKAPLKKDSSVVSQKLQVLNALGASGWELVDQQATAPAGPTGFAGPGGGDARGVPRVTTTTMLFKRRVP